ncbi:hypothetical protein OGAPHI_003664 [Ogataea philodendri]|uniref:Xylanolytic transcriptional activator regulatory domain-containing protein n=1 Tax=Ogataea philodendri TaxID=1378263 RepID=A0A9P8T4Q1_9ASCO|nr:uncharacterized protein OGAPHI_003664 [Ogataea philodendri]KAH3665479.1 hypothetical protein OGAPHI_003664 [Ogataea philodendri]
MKYLSKLHDEISKLKIENANLRSAMKSSRKETDPVKKSDAGPAAVQTLATGSSSMNISQLLNHEEDEPDKPDRPANEVIPPFLDKYGRMIHSRTGEGFYIGNSSMTLFGLEINRLVAPLMNSDAPASLETPATDQTTDTVLEREGNAYRIVLGQTLSRPGINVNFALPSYSYAMLLVDTFISYNDGCFYFFNEGMVKENLRRLYNDDGAGFQPDFGGENESILETIWFCKILLIFAVGEIYLGTANDLNGYKIKDKKKKQKLNRTTPLPGSGFFVQASELFTAIFSSGSIDNCAKQGGIEVLLLYAFYLQVADCTIASYFYFGMALRASLIMGFHVDVGKDSLNRYELEHRRRLWWTVYIFERMLASKAGLPLSLTDDDISTELPDDFDMSNPPEGCENYIFPEAEFIRNCVKITQINANILRKLYTRQPSSNILPIVHELVVSLFKWKKALPDYVNCDYQQTDINVNRLVVNMMTEYFQGINLAVRPLLFHFVLLNLKSEHPKSGTFLDLSSYSSTILTLLNASFQASINTIRSLWALVPENMLSLFGYMDREYLFAATATLVLFNATFGVHDATLEHLDHALIMFTKMRNLGNHPAALRRDQLIKLLTLLDFNGRNTGLIRKHTDNIDAPTQGVNHDQAKTGTSYYRQDQAFSWPPDSQARLGPLRESMSPGVAEPHGQFFSPSLLPSMGQIGDVPDLDSMVADSGDIKLWKDVTDQAVWLAGDIEPEFNILGKI